MDMPLLCHIRTHYARFQFDETPMNTRVYPDTQIAPLLYINITRYIIYVYTYTIIYMCVFYFIIIINVGMWNIYSIYKGLEHGGLLKNAE